MCHEQLGKWGKKYLWPDQMASKQVTCRAKTPHSDIRNGQRLSLSLSFEPHRSEGQPGRIHLTTFTNSYLAGYKTKISFHSIPRHEN
jgi:hypothetical protein